MSLTSEERERILGEPKPRLFNMLSGPPIPWELAEAIHKYLYLATGSQQSLHRIHERGGFDYGEIRYFAELLEKRRQREELASRERSQRSS